MRQTRNRSACPKGDAPRGESRAQLYDEVTATIIAQLEAGRFPWVQPWGTQAGAQAGGQGGARGGGEPSGEGSGLAPALPHNALTGRTYSGVNVLLLWGSVIEGAYPSQGWLTFRQALEAGGHVRKGEKGVTVVYADRFTPEAETSRAKESGEDARSVPFLKRFTVFNVAQCEGLREGLFSDPEPLPEREIVPLAEEVIAASGIPFRIGGAKAFYVPSADYVQVASALLAINIWIILMVLIIITPCLAGPPGQTGADRGQKEKIGATLAAPQHLFLAQVDGLRRVGSCQTENLGQVPRQ